MTGIKYKKESVRSPMLVGEGERNRVAGICKETNRGESCMDQSARCVGKSLWSESGIGRKLVGMGLRRCTVSVVISYVCSVKFS